MTTPNTLAAIADEMAAILPKFVSSSDGLILRSPDAASFKRLATEAKAAMDVALGLANTFSLELGSTIATGSVGFFGGPSYACVEETIELIRGAVNHANRLPMRAVATTPITSKFVADRRIAELSTLPQGKWDFSRLLQLCRELNANSASDCNMSVAMLVRAIVDHIPPVFGLKNFNEVANNYDGGKSFKEAMQTLERSVRNIAGSHLHTHIRERETIPSSTQVDFRRELDVLLGEVVRVSRDRRTPGSWTIV